MLTFGLNTAEFSRQIGEIVRVTGKEAGEVVREEAGLFTKDVVKFTPPFGSAPSTESFGAQRKVGEAAVERDIKRVFTWLDLSKINSEGVRKRLEELARAGDVDGIKDVLKGCRIPVNTVLLEVNERVHDFARGSRGRVQKWKRIWVVRSRGIAAYIRKKKADVGKSKAGWVAAAQKFGVKLPSWITRHGAGGGSVRDESKHATEPKITITNHHGSGGPETRIVERAMKNRVRNIKAKLERIAKSGWKRK